ncbi:MAG: carbamoyltransferase HypF, partial [Desulfobacterales bacterium]|nr:carbamoyltransferase HypF [Desulfobacterales bacterium]
MKNPRVSKRLEINGIVQGVGFRPFIYQLASRFGLNGDVANTASGVIIHAEGAADAMASFQEEIAANPPPLARITEFRSRDGETKNFTAFTIVKSEGGPGKSTLISPDTSICEDCLRELFDPDDRRYRYPFINCTNCGPRYTIIDDIPYDRPFTSMRHFKMCPACQTEYDDPGNRRFHAQPNACDDCGPHVCLHDNTGKRLAASDPIAEAAGLLKQGHILAVKGLGGFHLAVDAENDDAAARLRRRKRREEKPLALMAPDLAHIRKFAALTPEREALLTS